MNIKKEITQLKKTLDQVKNKIRFLKGNDGMLPMIKKFHTRITLVKSSEEFRKLRGSKLEKTASEVDMGFKSLIQKIEGEK